jgi:hypothetical protein
MNRAFKYFGGMMFSNGFYRGWNARYDYKFLNEKDDDLIMDKIIRGTFVGIAHTTWYCPIAIYQAIGRAEIQLRNKNPRDYPHLYKEVFVFTTLN